MSEIISNLDLVRRQDVILAYRMRWLPPTRRTPSRMPLGVSTKFVESLFLGSVASLIAITGTPAADLPARKVEPAEYLRICATQGPGFFYIPGSDACIRIGGRLRYEYVATKAADRNSDPSSFYALGRISVDARNATEWGMLRAFVRVDFSRRSGDNFFGSSSAARRGEAIGPFTAGTFPGFASVDTSGARLQTGVAVTSAFVQWGGLSAGRMPSFFDFFNGDDNWFGITDSDALTQALAYTYTFGSGFSATLSIEDPKERQINPIAGFAAVGSGGINPAVATAPFTVTYPFALSPYAASALSPAGAGSAISYVQRASIPDLAGVLRVDQAWGSAQLSSDYHRVSTVGATVTSLTPAIGGGLVVNPLVPSVPAGYGAVHGNGIAVQGGVMIKLPMLTMGDRLYLQAAYSKGNTNYSYMDYSFPSAFTGTAKAFGGTTFSTYEGVVGPTGRLTLTPAFFASVSFQHYWTPTIHQGFFAGGEHVSYSGAIRTAAGFAAGAACPTCFGTVAFANGSSYNPYSPFYTGGTLYNIGTTLVWTPVKDLDLGMEALYFRDQMAHRQYDANAGAGKLIKSDNALNYRLRVSRDF
jgi:Porin subfamily